MNRSVLFFALFFAVSVSAQKVPALNQKTAVLVVGKDVGAYAVEELNGLHDLFVAHGIFVYKYYYPNADWAAIQKTAQLPRDENGNIPSRIPFVFRPRD